MKIEIKKVRIVDAQSRGSLAFTADVYLDGVKTAQATNSGNGGCTVVELYSSEGFTRLQEACKYCMKHLSVSIKKSSVFPSYYLGQWVDELLGEHIKNQFLKGLKKKSERGIIYGDGEGDYYAIRFQRPIAEYLNSTKGVDFLKRTAIEEFSKYYNEHWKILNENIPEGIINDIQKAIQPVERKLPNRISDKNVASKPSKRKHGR